MVSIFITTGCVSLSGSGGSMGTTSYSTVAGTVVYSSANPQDLMRSNYNRKYGKSIRKEFCEVDQKLSNNSMMCLYNTKTKSYELIDVSYGYNLYTETNINKQQMKFKKCDFIAATHVKDFSDYRLTNENFHKVFKECMKNE